jgi:hypothetical protein
MTTMKTLLAATVLCCVPLFPAQSTDPKPVLKVFIDKMPNDLDRCLRAEFSKQMEGRVVIVLAEKDADATITAFSMVNKDRSVLLWSDELEGRDVMSSVMKPGEEPRLVERFVSKLKREVDK